MRIRVKGLGQICILYPVDQQLCGRLNLNFHKHTFESIGLKIVQINKFTELRRWNFL